MSAVEQFSYQGLSGLSGLQSAAASGVDPATWDQLTGRWDKALGVTSGPSGVEQHDDQEASARHLVQATPDQQPDETANGIEADGDDRLTNSTDVDILLPWNAFTWLCVGKFLEVTTNGADWLNDAIFMDSAGYFGLMGKVASPNKTSGPMTIYHYNYNSGAVTQEDSTTVEVGDRFYAGGYYDGDKFGFKVFGGDWIVSGSEDTRSSITGSLLVLRNYTNTLGKASYDYILTRDGAKSQADIDDALTHLAGRSW